MAAVHVLRVPPLHEHNCSLIVQRARLVVVHNGWAWRQRLDVLGLAQPVNAVCQPAQRAATRRQVEPQSRVKDLCAHE